ncbi:MAG: hypothetical protein IT343_20250 [Candidatus Melainabacteria bacterium]|nr:hypothetical protein [Candidatus Melainabacteria bacterium]
MPRDLQARACVQLVQRVHLAVQDHQAAGVPRARAVAPGPVPVGEQAQ